MEYANQNKVLRSDKPLVTVIIPYYNNDNEKFLRACFESIVQQTYSPIEFIVINDGSTDKASAFLEKLQSEFHFIIKKQENKGISGALNTGIKVAKGKYIAYMGADDYWANNKINMQVEFLENADESMAACCTRSFYVFENNASRPVPRLTRVLEQNDLIFDNLLKLNCVMASSVMIKREIFNEIGFFDEKSVLEDWDMWLRITDKYELGFLAEPLTYHRRHLSNRSNRFDKEMYETMKYIVHKWKGRKSQKASLNEIEISGINNFARYNKTTALKIALFNIQCANKWLYWRGIFKIFVPGFIYPKK